MSRLLKTVLLSAYSALFIQLLKSFLTNRNIEIVEIEYGFGKTSLIALERAILMHKNLVTNVNMTFEDLQRLPTDYKYVLKWTKAFSHYNMPLSRNGQLGFLLSNCTYSNCYLTNDKALFPDVRYFDAILFDVENTWDYHPIIRSHYQNYIFTASESASLYPVCNKDFDNYYNLTWTYRLDSDIRWSYITFLHKNGSFAGPKMNMDWIDPMLPTSDSVKRIISKKNKTAAWFVSNCYKKSQRQNVTDHLKVELKKFGLDIDVFGWCGPLRCPKDQLTECLDLLEQQYFFYLAFENSMDEDYVTEKVLYALLHHTVPIVLGGANYSRFLPPGSYIDASALDIKTVAQKMFEAISHPDVYAEYFRWHNHYVYKKSSESKDLCNLCKILNEPTVFKSVKNLRKWWNKDRYLACSEPKGRHSRN